jgi:excisionase family DNA binding protein
MTALTYFTRREAAEYVRLSEETIKAAIYDGRLRAKKSGKGGGGRVLISRADLDAWFDGMTDA